jgi:hypothetical protein
MTISGVIPLSLIAGNAAAYGIPHAPIHIDGNADFAAQAAAEGWPGDGSSGNPYILADYDIDSSFESGITINNTDVYFVLSGENILSWSWTFAFKGVQLTNVKNGMLTGVVSQLNVEGLYMKSCSNIAIVGGAYDVYMTGLPDYSWNSKGIYAYKCDNITINGVLNNYANTYGIYVAASDNVTVTGGDFSAGTEGIYVGGSKSIIISGVTSYSNAYNGIDVRTSRNVQITDVISTNYWNGIYLSGDSSVTVSGTETSPSSLQLSFNGYNGLYATTCTDLTVDGGEFITNTRSGIFMIYCVNPQILNSHNTANGNYYNGMMLTSCQNVRLENDYSTLSVGSSGYFFSNCEGVEFVSSVADYNDVMGVYVKGGKDVTVSSSSFGNNYMSGVYGTGVQNLVLNDCDASSNTQNGIYLISVTSPEINSATTSSNGWNGINLVSVPNAAVFGGSMTGNGWNGIYVKGSASVVIDGVTADSNTNTGIYAATCPSILIYNGTSASNNGRDGLYQGVCSSPTIDGVIATGNAWFGVRSLGCTLVTIVSTDLTGNTYGETYWPNTAPIASFTAGRIVMLTDPVSFDASASVDYDGTIVAYLWDFGDSTSASVGTPTTTHIYTAMDNFVVKLSVRDNGGRWSTEVSNLMAVQTNLSAKIIMPDKVTEDKSVDLTAAQSYHQDPARSIVAYEWDFDDGSGLGSGISVTHSWSVPGTYMVGLRVQDDQGRWSPVSTSRLLVAADTVSGLSVQAARHSLFPGETTTLEISAVDGAGNLVSTCTSTVEVNANRANYGWTGLPATVPLVGGKVSIPVSCSKTYSYNITANILGDAATNGYEHVTIANRTVEITVYDLGQSPLGSVEDVYTWKNYSRAYTNDSFRGKWGDHTFRYGSPMALQMYSTGVKIAANIDTTDRVHAEARGLSEINMANPTFFPSLNTGTGGQVEFSYDYHYMNQSEFWWWNAQPSGIASLPRNNCSNNADDQYYWGKPYQFSMYSSSASAYDGWETWIQISVTMDESAAWQMIGMPSINFTTDPVNWWKWMDWDLYERKNETVKRLWEAGFMTNEGGSYTVKGRLDIQSCDDAYAWYMGYWSSMFQLNDNHDGTITMTIDRFGYGEDTLLARWLLWGGAASGWNYPNGTPEGIIPWEPYYDDFHMSGTMDDVSADLTLDAGNIYAMRAFKSADPNVPTGTAVWRWEQIRIDYSGSGQSPLNDRSEMDLWVNNAPRGATFEVWDPAGIAWGATIQPDQSPNIMYLGLGTSLIMERPRTAVSGILPGPLVGDASRTNDYAGSGYNNWVRVQEKFGNATLHPLGCSAGTSVVDKGTGDLVMVGPFVPIIEYYDAPISWLWKSSAPLIEYWIQ